MNFKIYIYFFFFIVSASYAQQQPQYGQYMFNQFALNPAYAGSRNVLQTSFHWRNQWDGVFPDPPKTYITAINGPMLNNKMALGFQMAGDKIGPKSSFGMLGTYAYRLRFRKSAIAAGIRFGFFQYTYNINQINYKDPEPIWNGVEVFQKTLPTADAGLFYNSSDMYVGLSCNQLMGGNVLTYNDPSGNNLTLSKIKPHYYLTTGKAFKLIDKGLVINPSLVAKYVAGAPVSIDVNCNILIDERIWIGTNVRSGYGIGMIAQVLINRNFKIGIARDRGVKWLGGFSLARSNEFLLQFDFSTKTSKSVSPKYL